MVIPHRATASRFLIQIWHAPVMCRLPSMRTVGVAVPRVPLTGGPETLAVSFRAQHRQSALRTLAGMNPTVQAALIAGGTTAIVGVAGFWSTVHATGRQIRNSQDAKLWQARAAVYVDVLAGVDYRLVAHTDAREVYDSPEWDRLVARLAAFGSAAAYSALLASMKAHANLSRVVSLPSGDVFDRAVAAAAEADNHLIEIIRAELQGSDKPLPDVQGHP